jgi:hypothetical protein
MSTQKTKTNGASSRIVLGEENQMYAIPNPTWSDFDSLGPPVGRPKLKEDNYDFDNTLT